MTAGLLAKYAAAGGVGACVSHAVAVPLDVVKTRVQQDPARFAGGGVLDSARALVREEGPGVLSRGLANTMLGFLLHGAFKYGGFEFLKQAFLESSNAEIATVCHDHRLATLLVAAALAESLATVALLPLEQTRIKMVSDETYAANVFEAVERLVREDGIDGLVTSLPPIYAKMIPFSMCQLATYDVAVGPCRETAAALSVAIAESAFAADASASVDAFAPALLGDVAQALGGALSGPFAAQIPASFLAATLASLASQPGDTLMSVMNENQRNQRRGATDETEQSRSTLGDDVALEWEREKLGAAFVRPRDETMTTVDALGVSVRALTKPSLETSAAANAGPASGSASGGARDDAGAFFGNDKNDETSSRRPGIAETATRLGFGGLYAGWRERLAHVAAVIVIQLVVYDDIKHALIR
jgi:solute carrier family 25 phosphate transporter 3